MQRYAQAVSDLVSELQELVALLEAELHAEGHSDLAAELREATERLRAVLLRAVTSA